jgi:hypothetical protein
MEKTELQEKFARASAAEKKRVEADLPIIKKMYDFISELRQILGTQQIGFELVPPEKINSSSLCGMINIKNKKFLISFTSYPKHSFFLSYTPLRDDSIIDYVEHFPENYKKRIEFFFELDSHDYWHRPIHQFADFIIENFARAKAREELSKYTLTMGGPPVHIFKEQMQ